MRLGVYHDIRTHELWDRSRTIFDASLGGAIERRVAGDHDCAPSSVIVAVRSQLALI
jgi:hypothetical protein